MKNNIYEYTKIRENIWQIAEDNGVYCTLVKGSNDDFTDVEELIQFIKSGRK